MTVKSFPRGGAKPLTKTPSNFLFTKKRNYNEKTTKKKSNDNETIYEEQPLLPRTAQPMNYQSLMEGMTILGRVDKSNQYEISVSLPGRLSGHIQATDISEAYTKFLQSLVESSENPSPEFKPLSELYKHNDYIVCYVKHTDSSEKHRVTLSLEPELINQTLDPEKLKKGSKIVCTVSSIEDHGYAVDTGIQILRGFLAHKDIDPDVKYYPGQQIFCTIINAKSTENVTTIKLSTKSKHLTQPTSFDKQPLDTLIPGIRLDLNIKKILSNGLQVIFNEDNIGYVNQIHLKNPLEFYKQDTNIIGTLLYVLPTVKFAYFTELSLDKEEISMKIGEIIPKAKVLFKESNGIVLNLSKGIRGFVSFKRTGVDPENISTKFIPHSVHKCRILHYDIFDRIYVVTMEPHLFKSQFITPETVKVGDVMTVQVLKIRDTGFAFVHCRRIFGDVPPQHFTDIDDTMSKKPSIGDKITARVWGRNKHDNGWLFTLKKSLVESKLPILYNINDAKVGSKYQAVIIRINKNGLFVSFFNNIKGWIPASKLSKESGGTVNYKIGQVLLTKIDSIDKEKSKICLSIVTDKSVDKKEDLTVKIGESVEGTIVESSTEGIYLKFSTKTGKELTGFLPAGHMAPCIEIGSYLSARYLPGDNLSAFIFSTIPDLLLSRTFVPQETFTIGRNLKPGDCLPCSIKEINSNQVKVILPIGDRHYEGIVPFNKIDNINSLYSYQIIIGKITFINKKKKIIYLSTSTFDIWTDAVKYDNHMVMAIDLLTLYLRKLKELSTTEYYKNRPIASVNLGQPVTGIVEKVTERGLVIKLENNVMGIVRPAHYENTFKIGDKVNGIILWINYVHELVEMTLLKKLVNCIKPNQNKLPSLPIGPRIKAEIILVTNWFTLALTINPKSGILIVLPTKSHVNDTNPDLKLYLFGKKVKCFVVVNRDESEMVPICLLTQAFDKKERMSVTNEEIIDQVEDSVSQLETTDKTKQKCKKRKRSDVKDALESDKCTIDEVRPKKLKMIKKKEKKQQKNLNK